MSSSLQALMNYIKTQYNNLLVLQSNVLGPHEGTYFEFDPVY